MRRGRVENCWLIAAALVVAALATGANAATRLDHFPVGEASRLATPGAWPGTAHAVLRTEVDRLESARSAKDPSSASLLLLLAASLVGLGLRASPHAVDFALGGEARPSRARLWQGVGLRAPPSSAFA